MSTKDNFCTKNYNSNKTSSTTNDEFMNVNLNVRHKTEELQPMQSKCNSISVTQNNKTIEGKKRSQLPCDQSHNVEAEMLTIFFDEPQQKLNNSSTESFKCCDVSQKLEQLNLNQNDKNCGEQNGKLEKGAINNSTLSLHIIAYENAIEPPPSHDLLQDEQIITTSVNQKVREDPFSLPREQTDEEGQKEVTEFHSSGRVMNDRPPLGHMPCFFQKEKETFFEWHSRVWSYLQDLSSYRNIKRNSQHQPIMNFADLTQLAAKFPFPLCDISPIDSRPFMIMMNKSSDEFDPRGLQKTASPSTTPKGLFVLADNGKKLRLPTLMVRQCNTLKDIIDVFSDTSKDPIPLPISEECLNVIFQYAKIFANDLSTYTSPGRHGLFHRYFDQFEQGALLQQFNLQQLAIIFKAADYLQFDRLLDDISKSIMFRLSKYGAYDDYGQSELLPCRVNQQRRLLSRPRYSAKQQVNGVDQENNGMDETYEPAPKPWISSRRR